MRSNMNRIDFVIITKGLKGMLFKCLYINKEVYWGKKTSYSFCDISMTRFLLKMHVHKCME